MQEEIVSYLRSNPEGCPSESIAENFLKFKSPDRQLAHVAVKAILSRDSRVYCSEGLWYARPLSAAQKQQDISTMPWAAVYLLTDTSGKRILHISVWDPLGSSDCILSAWISDPSSLSSEDRELLTDFSDEPFDQSLSDELLEQIAVELRKRVPVFFSHEQYSLFALHAFEKGIGVDTYFLMSQLFKASRLACPRPLQLESAAASVSEYHRTALSAYKRGEQFSSVVCALFEKMKESGIETYEQLEEVLLEDVRPVFAGKDFSQQTIASLPERPGVYGFRNREGEYIYIGKASNMRRRLQSYFRFNDESPEKLKQLRNQAYSFTLHPCGSELESLLYEYRLIKKYKPPLNRQIRISERRGDIKMLEDSVYLLPHAETGKGMLVWIRKEQKIRLRPFSTDWNEEQDIIRDLDEYFFSEKLKTSKDDFPELEIATRWIKRNQDKLYMIPAGNLASSKEVMEAIKNSWKEFEQYQC
ncbi:MAG: nucleotide excision repair endonuclease [Chitinispirillaceae bacterium]